MFRVSRRVDYGLKLLIALAADQSVGAQATSRLATRLDIPLAFLHQIGRSLIQAGMVRSTPGPGGGLRLNQPAEAISLLQILEALDGPVRLSSCLEQAEEDGQVTSKTSNRVWADVQAKLVGELSGIRLSALVKQALTHEASVYSRQEYSAQNPAVAY